MTAELIHTPAQGRMPEMLLEPLTEGNKMQRHAFGSDRLPARIIGLAVVAGLVSWMSGTASAVPINGGVEAPTPDVFYNFYVPPVPAGSYPGFGAQLYVSPRPVPPRVGHTWITYPPFMPHEFLYKHRRHYIRPYGATGFKTDVRAYWY